MLDTVVRNIEPPTDHLTGALFAHRQKVRRRLASIFSAAGLHDDCRRAGRLSSCGLSRLAFTSTDSQALLIPYSCAQRVCPTCSRQKSIDRWLSVLSYISHRPTLIGLDLRWITLTLRDPAWGTLEKTLPLVLKAFARFRRSEAWSDHVDGSIWNFEITINRRKETWHPHIHVLYDGSFWPWASAKKSWQNHAAARGLEGNANVGQAYCIRDGQKAKPTRTDDLQKVLLEVTKYHLKPFDSADTPSQCILELTYALHNRRLWGSSGSLSIPPERRPDNKLWFLLGGLGRLLQDPESLLWTDPAFNAALVMRAANLSAIETAELIDAYPDFSYILFPPDRPGSDDRQHLSS